MRTTTSCWWFQPSTRTQTPRSTSRSRNGWKKALQADADRIIDIRVPPKEAEAIKYVAKPADYLMLVDGEWHCDIDRLETLHYRLAHRRMIAWSRSLSDTRRRLGFLDEDEASEDLVDVGPDENGYEWVPVRVLGYRWTRGDDGRWAYRLKIICRPETVDERGAGVEHDGGDDG